METREAIAYILDKMKVVKVSQKEIKGLAKIVEDAKVQDYLKRSTLILDEIARFGTLEEILNTDSLIEKVESNYWESGKKVDVYTKGELDFTKLDKLMQKLENERKGKR